MKNVYISMLIVFFFVCSPSYAAVVYSSDKSVFDYVISYWRLVSPDKNPDNIARAKHMEDAIRFWAIATYEGSRGKHRLGSIIILQDGLKKDQAHIKWVKGDGIFDPTRGGSATGGGYPYKTGGQINLCDSIAGNMTEIAKPWSLGFLLAHEAGHYVYKLGDEYAIAYNDTPVTNSIMDNMSKEPRLNAEILSFSTKFHIEEAKKYMPRGRVFTNPQFRIYSQSCWETLMSNTDPVSADSFYPQFPRVRYTNLHFDPQTSSDAFTPFIGINQFDWDNAPFSVKRDLKIRWSHGNAIMLVIDGSESMGGKTISGVGASPLSATKEAAKEFVKALSDDCVLGIIDFNTANRLTVPPKDLSDKDRRKFINEKIDSMTASGQTAIYDAVYSACEILSNDYPDRRRFVVLITDGEDNKSTKKSSDIFTTFKGSVQLHIIGTGDVNKGVLNGFSSQMNGVFCDSSVGNMKTTIQPILKKIIDVQIRADTILNSRRNALASSISPFNMKSLEVTNKNHPFFVNSNTEKVAVTLSYKGNKGDISVTLKDPDGQVITKDIDHQNGKWTADVITPKMGRWDIDIKYNTNRDIDIDFYMLTYPLKGYSGYTANIGFLDKNALKDNPIVDATEGVKLGLAVAIEGDPLTGINLLSQITHPSGAVEDVYFIDESESGFYSAFYDNFSTNGVYTVTVKASNEDGKGKLSFKSYMGDNGPGGVRDWSENFETSEMFQFIVNKAAPFNKVTSVRIRENNIMMNKGDRIELTTFVIPANATNQQIDWFSSDNSIVAVSRNGEIVALRGGTAVISAITADGNHQANSKVAAYENENVGCNAGLGAMILMLAVFCAHRVKITPLGRVL